ncbi:MAG TPA: zinc ribbon domain-containing protein, partial [Dehalococcoidia bacterium]|nr:zinc ribbon domain-containing protein [Dehalococcoidia bacterium]
AAVQKFRFSDFYDAGDLLICYLNQEDSPMPLYDFRCPKCGLEFEVSRPFSRATEPANCPQDNEVAERVYTMPVSFVKGGGGEAPSTPSPLADAHGHDHGHGHSHGPGTHTH